VLWFEKVGLPAGPRRPARGPMAHPVQPRKALGLPKLHHLLRRGIGLAGVRWVPPAVEARAEDRRRPTRIALRTGRSAIQNPCTRQAGSSAPTTRLRSAATWVATRDAGPGQPEVDQLECPVGLPRLRGPWAPKHHAGAPRAPCSGPWGRSPRSCPRRPGGRRGARAAERADHHRQVRPCDRTSAGHPGCPRSRRMPRPGGVPGRRVNGVGGGGSWGFDTPGTHPSSRSCEPRPRRSPWLSAGSLPAGEVERNAHDPEHEAADGPDLGRVQLDRADGKNDRIPLLSTDSGVGVQPEVASDGAEDHDDRHQLDERHPMLRSLGLCRCSRA